MKKYIFLLILVGSAGNYLYGSAHREFLCYYQIDNTISYRESDAFISYSKPTLSAIFYKATGKYAATCHVRLRGEIGPRRDVEETPENAKIIFSDFERLYKEQLAKKVENLLS